MPWPTKPLCSGSWPEPPPEISATLPGFSARRRTNLYSSPSVTISECAAQNPSRLSRTTVSGALISFFMRTPPRLSVVVARQARKATRKIRQHLVDRAVLLGISEVGHRHGDGPQTMRMTVGILFAARMRARVSLKKLPSVFVREMTDLENGRQMRRWDRHRIGRIGDLRNEGAVLAQGDGKALARSRRAVLEHAPQDILVVGDGRGRSRADFII